MAKQVIGTAGGEAALVHDEDYGPVAASLIARARHYCLAMVFIVDPDPVEDDDLLVDGLLRDMAAAAWRGVDARLVIGGSRTTGDITDATLLGRARARMLGLPCRLVAAREQPSNHTKCLVSDGHVLLGSHNWSPGALTGQRQDSVLIADNALAAHYLTAVLTQWETAAAEGFDVPD